MAVTFEQAKGVAEQFNPVDLITKAPYAGYVNGVGVSTVALMDPQAPADILENHCVIILLEKALPSGMEFPREHDGVRIYTRIVGKIEAL